MHITDIILKKRSGEPLDKEEIEYFINGYAKDEIPDYQISALLMAIWFRGMDKRETTDMTLAMMRSGDQIDLSAIPGIKVDKHSTGGVADTTTLVVAPLVAACGGRVAKMSGRGLGHTGGTLDKLESIPGVSIDQTMERFAEIVSDAGVAVIGQTGNLVPADKKLYALRDVTATIDNISLIAGSIMSKKLASGANAIVLDVKTGSGAFMKEPEDAKALGRAMVDIGTLAGRNTIALVTDMNQPLGNAVGNALEVQEAIEILQGKHEGDLKEVSFSLAANMLIVSEICADEAEARGKLQEALDSGEGLNRLRRMIEAQGGDPSVCGDPEKLPQAARKVTVESEASGYLQAVSTADVGLASMLLGAGREKKTDVIDPAVGLWMKKRLGDRVEAGDPLAVFYVNDEKNLKEAVARFRKALTIGGEKREKTPLIYQKIAAEP